MSKTNKVLVLGLALGLSACATGGTNQTIGTVVGAGGGALIGSQIGGGVGNTVATAGGAVLGALAGSALGKNLDDSNKSNK